MPTYLARQPIFDQKQHVFGYELLFRAGIEDFSWHDADQASMQVLDNATMGFSLKQLLGGKMAFVNATRRLLLQQIVEILPSQQTIIQIGEGVESDNEIQMACGALKKGGYLIALDDFRFQPQLLPLLGLADIVKVNFTTTKSEERGLVMKHTAQKGIRFIASKLETRKDFTEALELGYSYFQGPFFCEPEMLSTQEIPAFKFNYMRFLHELHQPQLKMNKLEAIIKQELSLSLKLLRYINSVVFGMIRKVNSIGQALVLLGERPVRKWATLIALTVIGDDRPQELMVISLIRGYFCELIAPKIGMAEQRFELFLTGLLSVLDALAGRPLPELLEELPLAPEIKAALLEQGPPYGSVLELALVYEQGDWERTQGIANTLGLSEEELSEIYCEAVQLTGSAFTV